MKNSKKILAFLLSACMVCAAPAVIAGCTPADDGTHTEEPENKAPVKVKDGTDLKLKEGESAIVTVSEYITANGNTVTVKSVDEEVATATLADGVVTVRAVAAGFVQVKISCGVVEVVFAVTVSAKESEKPAVEFGDITAALNLSKAQSVDVKLAPKSGGDGVTFTYSVATPVTGASVSGDTLTFTASEAGNFEITVKAVRSDDAQAEFTFKVKIAVTDGSETVYYTVTVDGTETRVEEGGEFTLPAYEGTPAEGKEFSGWLVDGVPHAVGDKITVDGNITVVSDFVNKKYAVSIDGVGSQYEHGAQLTLSADKYVGEISDGKMLAGWLVDGERKSVGSVITVSGPIVITAIIEDEPLEAPVKVKDAEDTSVYLADGAFTLSVAEYITTNGNAVAVASSESGVAGVSESGGVAAGNTTVTLTCRDIEISFAVTVKNAVPEFGDLEVSFDKALTLKATANIVCSGADTFSYGYSGDGVTVEDGVLTYTADGSITAGAHEITVSVTATDSATNAIETTSFKLTVNVTDTSAYRIVNGGFETGDITGWTLSDPALEAYNIVQDTAGYWGNTAAYNHGGTYHFNGQESNGIPEDKVYTLTSSTFTLGGSGFISFKIGGRAAVVKIYDAATDVLLAQYSNTNYADHDIGHLELGARQATMSTYVADLREYLGLELYLVLEDNLTGGWGHAIMDDVITYYETEPVVEDKFDRVTNLCEHGGTTDIPWTRAVSTVAINRLQITRKIDSKLADGGTVNLTEYLAEAEGKLAGDASAEINKRIVKVSDGENEYTENFDAFALTAGKTYTVTYELSCGGKSVEAKFAIAVKDTYQIANGSFETGDLIGWTYTVADGSTDFGRVESADYYWNNAANGFNKQGNYLFTGIETVAGTNQETGKGTLRSVNFTLKQNGWISFLMGGAHNANCGIRVRSAADDSILAEFNNLDKGHDGVMDRYKYQFSGMDGEKECYIEIFDEAEGGWGLVVVDDIRTALGDTEPEGTLISSVK